MAIELTCRRGRDGPGDDPLLEIDLATPLSSLLEYRQPLGMDRVGAHAVTEKGHGNESQGPAGVIQVEHAEVVATLAIGGIQMLAGAHEEAEARHAHLGHGHALSAEGRGAQGGGEGVGHGSVLLESGLSRRTGARRPTSSVYRRCRRSRPGSTAGTGNRTSGS